MILACNIVNSHKTLSSKLDTYLFLCEEGDASRMDPYRNSGNRNQQSRGNTRSNSNEDDSEEKGPYRHAETPPFVDVNSITTHDVLQQRIMERLQAEERLMLRQQNQQLLQLAQTQSRRRQLLDQQIRQNLHTSDPVSAMPQLSDNNSNNNNPLLQSPQLRQHQLEYLRARRQNLMQMHLIQEQQLRREEELLEAVLLRGGGGGGGRTSLLGTDSDLLTSDLNMATGMIPGIHPYDPDISLPTTTPRRGRLTEDREILNRMMLRQQQQASLVDVDDAIDQLDSSMRNNIRDMDMPSFAAQINTAPADFRAIDPSRLDPNIQLSRRYMTGQARYGANYLDQNIQGIPLRPLSTTAAVALPSTYPAATMGGPATTKSEDKKKPAEKKKSASRKKLAGMVCWTRFERIFDCHVVVGLSCLIVLYFSEIKKIQPKRPLHAYNIYFQEERQKILKEIPSPPEHEDEIGLTPGAKRKRRRRGTHGKITFASLAKEIGFKWHNLSKEEKEQYQQLAEVELKRYDDEMDAYNLKQKEKEREERESLDKKPKAKSNVGGGKKRGDNDDESDDEDDVDGEDSLSVVAVSAKKTRHH